MKRSPGKELWGQQIGILTRAELSRGKLLGLSEPQIPHLQTEVDEDTVMAHLQFVERN